MTELRVRCALQLGAFGLDVDLRVPTDGVTSLFGPSGSGKTTLLRCIAGFERRAVATIRLGDEVWQDAASGAFVAPWRRPVGFVFQEPGLFPHLSVRGNLRFGFGRVPAAERRLELEQVVEWLGLGELLDRSPLSLSGGERQRVAMGRALLTSPRLLLMDEPLAALDERSRRQILPYLEALPAHLDLPVLYVSHSISEVARLCERVVCLERGRILQQGSTVEVLSSVDLAWTGGDAVGAVLEARVAGHDDADHLTELAVPGGALWVGRLQRQVGEAVRVQVPARDVSLALDPEARSSLLNVLPCAVLELRETDPGRVVVRLQTRAENGAVLLARITRRSCAALDLRPGTEVFARVKSVGLLS